MQDTLGCVHVGSCATNESDMATRNPGSRPTNYQPVGTGLKNVRPANVARTRAPRRLQLPAKGGSPAGLPVTLASGASRSKGKAAIPDAAGTRTAKARTRKA